MPEYVFKGIGSAILLAHSTIARSTSGSNKDIIPIHCIHRLLTKHTYNQLRCIDKSSQCLCSSVLIPSICCCIGYITGSVCRYTLRYQAIIMRHQISIGSRIIGPHLVNPNKMSFVVIREDNLFICCKDTIRIHALFILLCRFEIGAEQRFFNCIGISISGDFYCIRIFCNNFISRKPINRYRPFGTCLNTIKYFCVFCNRYSNFIQFLKHFQKLKISCQTPWQFIQNSRIKLNRTGRFLSSQILRKTI